MLVVFVQYMYAEVLATGLSGICDAVSWARLDGDALIQLVTGASGCVAWEFNSEGAGE